MLDKYSATQILPKLNSLLPKEAPHTLDDDGVRKALRKFCRFEYIKEEKKWLIISNRLLDIDEICEPRKVFNSPTINPDS